jgi:hypothetical protein
MQGWLQFYAVAGTASATLVGLLFVAVSINAAASLGEGREGSRRLAEQAFQNYVTVILVSLLALFPDAKLSNFGLVALVLSAFPSAWAAVRFYLSIARPTAGEPRLAPLRRHFSSLIGYGMLLYAGAHMALGVGDSRDTFAAATIVLVSSATVVSWELMLRLAGAPRPVREASG